MRRHVVPCVLLLLASCAGAEDVGSAEGALAQPGPWDIPDDTIAVGDTQYVEYTGAGPWVGESGCGGSLLEGTRQLREWLMVAFPQISSIGGYSCRAIVGDSSTMSVHATGRALDIMIPTVAGSEADNDLGDPIGNYLIEHAEEIGIQFIIWDRWTWGAHRASGSKERMYGGAHPHNDHLHVELSVDAAAMRTPWFSGSRPLPDVTCGTLPADGGVIEETDDCFVAYGPATYWRTESVGHGGSTRWTNAFSSSTPSNWARWHIDVEEGGDYAVEIYAPAPSAVHRATRYLLMHGGVEHEVTVDLDGADGWVRLGTFPFAPGGGQHLSVYDNSPGAVGSDQHIPADAIRCSTRVDPTVPEPTPELRRSPSPCPRRLAHASSTCARRRGVPWSRSRAATRRSTTTRSTRSTSRTAARSRARAAPRRSARAPPGRSASCSSPWSCAAAADGTPRSPVPSRVPVRRGSLLLTLSLLLAPSVARAGNGDGILLGNQAAITGGAVASVIGDGTATWYNPAGLASMERDAVDVSGNAFQVRAAEEGGLISSTTGESNDGGYLELLSIPSASTIARRLEPGLVIAFGVFAPRFSQHTVRTGLDAGLGPDRARWTLASTAYSATYQAGGAIGIRLDEHVRFGVSLFGVYRERSDTFQTAGAFAQDGATRLVARGGITQVRSLGAELGLGVQWEPYAGFVLGVTFRSPGLELLTQIRSTTTSIDVTVDDASPDAFSFVPEDSEDLAPGIAVLTAGRFVLALGHRFDRGWIAAELDLQPPLALDGVLSRRFVWNVRVGGRYEVDEQIGVGAGLFTDHSELDPIEELGQTRVDFYGLSAGFEYRSPHRLGPGERSDDLVFSTTVGVRYALGVGEVGGLLFDPQRGVERATVPISTTIHELSLHIGSGLYF
ncbi:MAG: hypothetical protein R3B82_25590 [Sandaracinaceae bacterium]